MHKIASKAHLRFGKIFVTDKFEIRRYGKSTKCFWLCECDCGTEKWICGSALKNIRSCGCSKGQFISQKAKNRNRVRHCKKISGLKFGRLTVLNGEKREASGKSFVTKVLCKCDCGVEKWIQKTSLVCSRKPTRSCGCLQREKLSEMRRLKPGEAVKNRLYSGYKLRAHRKGLTFLITKEEFNFMLHQPCYYCNEKNVNYYEINGTGLHYNGIDRIDSAKGYEKGNVVSCCGTCNVAKQSLTLNQFYSWIEKVYINVKRVQSSS